MFVILQGGLTALVPRLDQTSAALIVTAAMFAVLIGIESWAFRRGVKRAFLALGFSRPNPAALFAAAIITLAMLAFFPLYAVATGTPLILKSDWLWVLLGAIVLNGIGEETLFRGYVYGHLRQAGHSFRRAGVISSLIFGAVHLFLFAGNPFVIAMLATLLAVSAAFPFAFSTIERETRSGPVSSSMSPLTPSASWTSRNRRRWSSDPFGSRCSSVRCSWSSPSGTTC
jgi:membrane protease YdiL (CAAX protease family)